MDQIQQVYESIKEKVLNLGMDPTQPLNEKLLIQETGGTAKLVHEALKRLAADRIVVQERDRWYVAREATSAIMHEIFEVRTTLEGMCARLAAERISDETVEGMERLLEDFERVLKQGDNKALLAVDQKFHKLLYEASGNRFLARALDEMYVLIYRLSFFALDRMGSVRGNVEEHREILQALKARDGRAAERIIQHHITRFQSMVEELL